MQIWPPSFQIFIIDKTQTTMHGIDAYDILVNDLETLTFAKANSGSLNWPIE